MLLDVTVVVYEFFDIYHNTEMTDVCRITGEKPGLRIWMKMS